MKWIANHFTAAEAGPEDVLACRLQRLFAADPRLVSIFGARGIEALPELYPFDFTDLPKLQVAPTLSTEGEFVPGDREVRPVELTVRIRYEQVEWEPLLVGAPIGEWPYVIAPSMSTLVRHVIALITASRELLVEVGGEQVALVSPGEWRFGPVSWTPDQDPRDEQRWAFNRDIRVTTNARLNSAGLFENVVAAGG